jgi:diacylglycerol kinase family enzyme
MSQSNIITATTNTATSTPASSSSPPPPTNDYSSLVPSALHGSSAFLRLVFRWLLFSCVIPQYILYFKPRHTYLAYMLSIGGFSYLLYSLRALFLDCVIYRPSAPPQEGSIENAYSGPKSTQTNNIKLKKVYLIVNPAGGNGASKQALSAIVLPLLRKNDVEVTLLSTQYAGHALHYARTVDLQGYDAILLMGGDGTLAEVTNGLFTRAANINSNLAEPPPEILPLGIIPCGSGNSFSLDCGNQNNVQLAVESILSGDVVYTDVNLLSDSSGLSLFSINEISFGLVGDAAVAAEYLRFLGAKRYDVAAVWMMLKANYHELTMRVTGIGRYNNQKPSQRKELTATGQFVTLFINNTQFFGSALRGSPLAKFDDGFFDLVLCQSATRGQLFALFQLLPSGAHYNSKHVQYIQAKKIEFTPKQRLGVINVDGEVVKYEGQISVECFNKVLPIILPPNYAKLSSSRW